MAKMWECDAFLEDGDEDFSSYVERFGHYCTVAIAKVEGEALKKSAFITAIGKKILQDAKRPSSTCETGREDVRRFGEGLRNPAIQKGLLKKKELTFDLACDFAKSVELAERESRGFQPTSASDPNVHAIKKASGRPASVSETSSAPKKKCTRCGEDHYAALCRFRRAKCYQCTRFGHLARACRAKQSTDGAVHNLSEQEDNNPELQLYNVYHVNPENPPFEVEVRLEKQAVKMQVDTGAAVSLISENAFKQLAKPPPLRKCAVRVRTYGAAPLQVQGQAEVSVDFNGKCKVLPIIVATGGEPALLGRD
ncbi:uncharacterized protein LOC120839338 [Ixodes scapularis]|uniref:uncharacterized protein LOC120839338 n=1 Tax=Ixodes scapularis TaxID=6945 RepID=UPI001A9E82AE|nr:uncharacterized protein LOC120839338 [Ixodes scapularis]